MVPEQDEIPEKELPATEALTAWLYQPPESEARAGAAVAVGEDAS